MSRLATTLAVAALAGTFIVAATCAPAGQREARAPQAVMEQTIRAVLLRELHTVSSLSGTDTLLTWIGPGVVRIEHRDGDALVDLAQDRLVLLDGRTSTYRQTSLAAWKASLRGEGSLDTLRFAPAGGGGEVAGVACERYHLFGEMEIFPGEPMTIEQEVWVARDLGLRDGALGAYREVLEGQDRVDWGAPVERPAGVVLRSQTHRKSAGPGGTDELEKREVIAIERVRVSRAHFDIPAGYARADTSAPGDSRP